MDKYVNIVDDDIDHHKIRSELFNLLEEYNIHHLQQVTVTTLNGENNFEEANGRFVDLTRPESEYNQVIECLRGSYIEKYITQFPDYYRWRLLKLTPRSCYSIHLDCIVDHLENIRLHIPVQTNPHCFMTFYEDWPQGNETYALKHYHMEVGKAYEVNTSGIHTAVNYGSEDRWHLVGVKYIDKLDK